MEKLQNIFIGKFIVVVPRKIKNILFEDWMLSHLLSTRVKKVGLLDVALGRGD